MGFADADRLCKLFKAERTGIAVGYDRQCLVDYFRTVALTIYQVKGLVWQGYCLLSQQVDYEFCQVTGNNLFSIRYVLYAFLFKPLHQAVTVAVDRQAFSENGIRQVSLEHYVQVIKMCSSLSGK